MVQMRTGQRLRITRQGAALLLAAAVALAGAALLGMSGGGAQAIAPCLAHTNTAEEVQFLGLVQQWRDANISGSLPLTRDDRLNQAAAGYAKFLADSWAAGGHEADGATMWARAEQCGYTTNGSVAVGGEGLASEAKSTGLASVGPQRALDLMAVIIPGHQGGLFIPAYAGAAPVKCVGAAKATSADGRKVAWVLLLMGRFGDCPYPVTGVGTSPTATATIAPPTPTRTPGGGLAYRVVLPALSRDAGAEAGGAAATPAPTQTATPTLAFSPTANASATVTATATPSGQVCAGTAVIVSLDKVYERVGVSGSGDLTGWAIVSTNGGERFTFPAGFVLNGTVTVQSQRVQADRPGQVWWTEEEIWSDLANDDAQLYDCTGALVQTFDDGR